MFIYIECTCGVPPFPLPSNSFFYIDLNGFAHGTFINKSCVICSTSGLPVLANFVLKLFVLKNDSLSFLNDDRGVFNKSIRRCFDAELM